MHRPGRHGGMKRPHNAKGRPAAARESAAANDPPPRVRRRGAPSAAHSSRTRQRGGPRPRVRARPPASFDAYLRRVA